MLEHALADEVSDLPDAVCERGAIHLEQIARLVEVVERLAGEPEAASKVDAELRRLCTVPGTGPVTAGALAAFAPDLGAFEGGRNAAASRTPRACGATLGLARPRRPPGGKARLGAASEMGQADIRRLLIVGAMSVIRWFVRKGWQLEPAAREPRGAQAQDGRGRRARRRDGPHDRGHGREGAGLPDGVIQAREARTRHCREAGAGDRRGVGETDARVQGGDARTRSLRAKALESRWGPDLPDSMTGRAPPGGVGGGRRRALGRPSPVFRVEGRVAGPGPGRGDDETRGRMARPGLAGQADADLVRERMAFAAERPREREVEAVRGAAKGLPRA